MFSQHSFKEMPFIKFPPEWEVQFCKMISNALIHFFVKKEGAPNVVSVCVFEHQPDDWELIVADTYGDGNLRVVGSEAMIPLKDVDTLLRFIEKKLYEEIEDPFSGLYEECD